MLVTLVSPEFSARLIEGRLLEALVDLPSIDKVALHGLKPPPPWCDRAFWLRACDRLRPLLARSLDQRLFLDCAVAARILKLGECPARADLTQVADGFAFRACVYQPQADFIVRDAEAAATRLATFVAPASCPFPIR